MGRRWTVEVTANIIEGAEERSSSHCMIADAIREGIPGARNVTVDIQTMRWSNPATNKRYICFTPRNAQLALIAFDQGIHSDPFTLIANPVQIMSIRTKDSRSEKPAVILDPAVRQDGVLVHEGKPLPLSNLPNRPSPRARKRRFGLKDMAE